MAFLSYIGLDQADSASIDVTGISFTCFVGLNHSKNQVEGVIMTRGESGQKQYLDMGPVRAAADIPANTTPDCPRVLGMQDSSRFIAHWVEITQEGSTLLHRAVFNVGNVDAGWVHLGSIVIHDSALYDACEVSNASTSNDFILVRRSLAGQIVTSRYVAGWTWPSVSWAVATAVTIADTVLSVTADDTDDTVIVNYQQASTLNTFRLNASDGLGAATVECFDDVLDGDNQFTAVASVRVSADAYMVVAEVANDADIALTGTYRYVRLVAWREVRGSTATPQNNSHWLYNVQLASSPWIWSTGTTNEVDVYFGLSHKSLTDGQEYVQSYGYVVRADYAAIQDASTAGTVYPIPVAAFMDGSWDGRVHGDSPANITPINDQSAARLNHLSNVCRPPLYELGPERKSVSFSHTRYTRLAATYDQVSGGTTGQDQELLPASSKLSMIVFHHEPQVMIRRFVDEPTHPDTPAWRGIPRASALPQEIPGFLVFGGGVTQVYDGYQLVELGFLWFPEILSFTIEEDPNYDLDPGTYWYTLTYAWTDVRGQLHRSPPAVPKRVTLANLARVVVEMRCANLSMKDDLSRYPAASSISIELWRTTWNTAGGGSIVTDPDGLGTYLFRRVFAEETIGGAHQMRDTPASDKTAFSVSATDDVGNSFLQYQELLPYQLDPTTLQWTPEPPSPHVPLRVPALWQSRVFGYGHGDRALRWSEQITTIGTQYLAPEVLDSNRYQLDDVGEVVALAAMDNGLFVFTRRSVFVLRGDPGAGGVGANLDLDTIPGAPGCLDPRSVVVTPQGIMYQSTRGIYAIGRETGIGNIGGPVENLVRAAGNIRGATVLEDRHEVRFVLQDAPGTGPLDVRPTIAIYNYRVNRWSTVPLPDFAQNTGTSRLNEMMHSCAWRGRSGEELHVVLAQGATAIERGDDDTVFSDEYAGGTAVIQIRLQTEWIKLAGVAGLKRVREIGVQTERINAGGMGMGIYYDTDGSYDETAPTDAFNWASPAPAYLLAKPSIQRITAMSFLLFESALGATENVRITNVTIRYQKKSTPRRVASTQIGT